MVDVDGEAARHSSGVEIGGVVKRCKTAGAVGVPQQDS